MVFLPASERVRGSIVQNVQRAGINFWAIDVDRYVDSEEVPEYHPFIQYFEELPEWDGVDRVTALAERVSSDDTWVKGFHRWMLAMSAQWMGYARKKNGVSSTRANSVAPIIISQEQGWGKSTFCRMLVPEALQTYYTDSFDVAQPSTCEKKLMDYGLINLDEFDRISSKRGAQLKNLMQMTALNIRRTYHKTSSGCFRLASFIGTSNTHDLLTDRSGSRRFLCVDLEHPIDCDTPIEYEQLYAQLKQEILSGERYWFSKEEENKIQENNKFYYKEVPVEELFRRTYREVDKCVDGAVYLNADEVFKELKTKFPTEMNGVNMDNFNRILPTFACRRHTHYGSRYCVVRL
jgi:predicted P-loop ATPase